MRHLAITASSSVPFSRPHARAVEFSAGPWQKRISTGCSWRSTYQHAVTALLTIFLWGCTTSEPAVEKPQTPEVDAGRYIVSGYHPWWMRDTWETYDPAVYDEIYFFSLDVDSTGSIAERNGWPDRWFRMQRTLVERGIRVTPVVTLFSQSAFERLFATRERSSVLLETLIGLLRDSPAVGGLQLDFEVYHPVSDTIRSNFTDFMRRLRDEMKRVRPESRLSLYALAYDESDVFDEAELARHADYLVVQGYDLHGRKEGKTGPVAGLEGWGARNWKYVVNRLIDLGVPRENIVMGVPYFGYEWPAVSEEPGARTTGSGATLTYAPVDSTLLPNARKAAQVRSAKYGERRDTVSGSPYYAFEDSVGWRQGWYEDAESLAQKYAYVKEAGLGGVAIFPPAYGASELTEVLRRFFGEGSL